MDKPTDAAIDVVKLQSNGKVAAEDMAGSSSALPFDQLHMVSAELPDSLQQETVAPKPCILHLSVPHVVQPCTACSLS
jgi:hypothetical protein